MRQVPCWGDEELRHLSPHADRRDLHQYPALFASSIFMNLLLSGVLGFFLLHTLLWLNRSLAERRQRRSAGAE